MNSNDERNVAILNGRMSRRSMLKRSAVAAAAVPTLATVAGLASTRRASAQDLSGTPTFLHGLTSEATILQNTILPAWTAANPNVKINVLQVPFDQLQNKYNTEVSAGGGPDVL